MLKTFVITPYLIFCSIRGRAELGTEKQLIGKEKLMWYTCGTRTRYPCPCLPPEANREEKPLGIIGMSCDLRRLRARDRQYGESGHLTRSKSKVERAARGRLSHSPETTNRVRASRADQIGDIIKGAVRGYRPRVIKRKIPPQTLGGRAKAGECLVEGNQFCLLYSLTIYSIQKIYQFVNTICANCTIAPTFASLHIRRK